MTSTLSYIVGGIIYLVLLVIFWKYLFFFKNLDSNVVSQRAYYRDRLFATLLAYFGGFIWLMVVPLILTVLILHALGLASIPEIVAYLKEEGVPYFKEEIVPYIQALFNDLYVRLKNPRL